MKSILLNEGDIPKTHDIKELYALMLQSFRDMFVNNPFPKKTIEKSLEKIKEYNRNLYINKLTPPLYVELYL